MDEFTGELLERVQVIDGDIDDWEVLGKMVKNKKEIKDDASFWVNLIPPSKKKEESCEHYIDSLIVRLEGLKKKCKGPINDLVKELIRAEVK